MTDLDIARRVCTPRQIQAAELKDAGYGDRRIGRMMGISKAAVKDLLDAAHRKVEAAKKEAA